MNDLAKLKAEWQADVWRDLGLSADDEVAARAQFAKRLRIKTKGATATELKAVGITLDDISHMSALIDTMPLSALVGFLLRCGINVNILIPTESVPATRGKLRILIKTDARTSVDDDPLQVNFAPDKAEKADGVESLPRPLGPPSALDRFRDSVIAVVTRPKRKK